MVPHDSLMVAHDSLKISVILLMHQLLLGLIRIFWGMYNWGTFHALIKSNPGYFRTGEQIKGGRFLAKISTGNYRSANESSSAVLISIANVSSLRR